VPFVAAAPAALADDDDGSRDTSKEMHFTDEEYDRDAGEIWVKDAPFVGAPAGTLHFLAPECLQHRGTGASDYWALGAILFRAASGELPM